MLQNLRDSKRTGSFTPEEVQSMNREMSALTLGVEPAFFDEYEPPPKISPN